MRHFIFAISILLISNACTSPATHEQALDLETTESISDLERFLIYNAESPEAHRAQQRLDELKERTAWEGAKHADTYAAYRDYLERYPDGQHTRDASLGILSLDARRELTKHLNDKSMAWWLEFLKKYSTTPEAKYAHEQLRVLEARNRQLRQAATVNVQIDYYENDRAKELPVILTTAVLELLRLQGYELIDQSTADLIVAIDAKGRISSYKYQIGTIRRNAVAEFEAEISIAHGSDIIFERSVAGYAADIPAEIPIGSSPGAIAWLNAGLTGGDAGTSSDLVKTFAELAFEVHGPTPLVAASQSDVPLVSDAAKEVLQGNQAFSASPKQAD